MSLKKGEIPSALMESLICPFLDRSNIDIKLISISLKQDKAAIWKPDSTLLPILSLSPKRADPLLQATSRLSGPVQRADGN